MHRLAFFRKYGFTLIEILMVAAIISVLAGIALVNMSRSKQEAERSRAKADIKTIVTALEAYRTDYQYPPPSLNHLTSPVAYLESIPVDPTTERPYGYTTDGWSRFSVSSRVGVSFQSTDSQFAGE